MRKSPTTRDREQTLIGHFQRDGVPTTVPLLFLSALRARASIAARAATHAAAAQCTRRPILRTRVHTIVHTHTKRNTPASSCMTSPRAPRAQVGCRLVGGGDEQPDEQPVAAFSPRGGGRRIATPRHHERGHPPGGGGPGRRQRTECIFVFPHALANNCASRVIECK